MWADALVGLLTGCALCGAFVLGAYVQRNMPHVVRTRDTKDTVEWTQIPQGRGWGTPGSSPPPTGYAHPMGPPAPPPDGRPAKLKALVPGGALGDRD